MYDIRFLTRLTLTIFAVYSPGLRHKSALGRLYTIFLKNLLFLLILNNYIRS